MKIKFIFLVILSLTVTGWGPPRPRPTPTPTPTATPTPIPTATPTPTPISGPAGLRIHPENQHYFQNMQTGEAVIIMDYLSLVPTDRSARFNDYHAQVDEMVREGIKYNRVWHFLPWAGGNAIWPWSRQSETTAPMGGAKINMDVWNTEYWDRMRDSLKYATDKGITSEILLFDRCGISPGQSDRWQGNPWASDNNVNGLETARSDGDGVPSFYEISKRPKMRQYQERYLKKMIDETINYNVIYEIENEHWVYDNPDWHQTNADFIRDYLNKNYSKIPRLIAYSSLHKTEREQALAYSKIDIHNIHFGHEPERNIDILNEYIENRWAYQKPINVDEFANAVTDTNLLRYMVWTILTSGGNFHIEDAKPESKPFEVLRNMRNFMSQSQWNFIKSQPNRNFSSTGYCMTQWGVEYTCYYRLGGKKSFLLPSGNYNYKWWDTVNGGFSFSGTLSSDGTNRQNLTTPSGSDWTLLIQRDGTLPTPTPTPPPDNSQCQPPPPPLSHFRMKVHNRPQPGKAIIDSTPLVCSGSNTPYFGYCQNLFNDPSYTCCPIRPEGDPLRLTCENEVLGKRPDGTAGPTFSFSGSGRGQTHSTSSFLYVVYGEGTVTVCSNHIPPVCASLYVPAQ